MTTSLVTNNRVRSPKYYTQGKRSIYKLKSLEYDPIQQLVLKYRELESELERQRLIRENKIVELTPTGKVRSFSPHLMLEIYEKQINIAEKLLRYKYGRVPESDNDVPESTSPLVINLTQKGETYVVNDQELLGEDDDLEERQMNL